MTKEVETVFGDGKIKVSWKSIEQAVEYEVALIDASTNREIVKKPTKSLEIFFRNINEGDTYYFIVTALDSNYRSIKKHVSEKITAGDQPMKQQIRSRFKDGRIEVSWETIERAVEYEIALMNASNNREILKKPTKNLEIAFRNVDDGEYYCTVTALDSGGKNIGQFVSDNVTAVDDGNTASATPSATASESTRTDPRTSNAAATFPVAGSSTIDATLCKSSFPATEMPPDGKGIIAGTNELAEATHFTLNVGKISHEQYAEIKRLALDRRKTLTTLSQERIRSTTDAAVEVVPQIDNANESDIADKIRVTTISEISAKFVAEEGHILASWEPPIDPAQKYVASLYQSGAGTAVEYMLTEQCEATFLRISPHEKYKCQIMAIYDGFAGTEAESNEVKIPDVNDAPTDIEAETSSDDPFNVSLRWKHPTTVAPAKYEIILQGNGEKVHKQIVNTLEYSYDNLLVDGKYDFYITSLRHNGVRGMSETRNFQTDGTNTEVENIETTADPNDPKRTTLSWQDPPAKPMKYEVHISNGGEPQLSYPENSSAVLRDTESGSEFACSITPLYGEKSDKRGRTSRFSFSPTTGDGTFSESTANATNGKAVSGNQNIPLHNVSQEYEQEIGQQQRQEPNIKRQLAIPLKPMNLTHATTKNHANVHSKGRSGQGFAPGVFEGGKDNKEEKNGKKGEESEEDDADKDKKQGTNVNEDNPSPSMEMKGDSGEGSEVHNVDSGNMKLLPDADAEKIKTAGVQGQEEQHHMQDPDKTKGPGDGKQDTTVVVKQPAPLNTRKQDEDDNKEQKFSQSKSGEGTSIDSSSVDQPSMTKTNLCDKPRNIEVHFDKADPFKVTLTWEPPENIQPKEYEIIIYEGNKQQTPKTTHTLTHTCWLADVGKQYGCLITTIKRDGTKGQSITKTFTINGAQTVPAGLQAKPSEEDPRKMVLTWNAPPIPPEKYEIVIGSGVDPTSQTYTKSLDVVLTNTKLDSKYVCSVTGLYGEERSGKVANLQFETLKSSDLKARDVSATFLDGDSAFINVAWKSSIHPANEYLVLLCESNGNSKVDETATTTCETKFTTLSPGEKYYCQIHCRYGGVLLDPQNSDEVQVADVSDEPLELTVKVAKEDPFHANIEWNPPISVKPQKYEVMITNKGKNVYSKTTEETNMVCPLFVLDETYLCTVTSIRYNGKEGKSAMFSEFRNNGELTKLPTIGTTASDTDPKQFTLRWGEPQIKPKSYDILVSQGVDTVLSTSTSELFSVLSDIDFDMNFACAVTPIYEADSRGRSSIYSFQSGEAEKSVPKEVNASLSPNNPTRVTVSWKPSNFNPQSYEVCFSNTTRSAQATGSDLNEAFDDLKLGQKYQYSVVAVFEGNSRGKNEIRTINTPEAIQLCPQITKACLKDSNSYEFIMEWKPGTMTPKKYDVTLFKQGENGGIPINNLVALEERAVFGNLQPQTEYFGAVVSHFESNRSPQVTSRYVHTPRVNIKCVFIERGHVECTWQGPPQPYNVILRVDRKEKEPIPVSEPRYRFNYAGLKLEMEQTFDMKLTARDNFATNFEVLQIGADTAVKNIKANADPEDPFSMMVTWEEPETKPDEYEVTALTKNNTKVATTHAPNSQTSANIPGLKLNTVYTFRVVPMFGTCEAMPTTSEKSSTPDKNLTEAANVDVTVEPFKTIVCWAEPTIKPKGYKVTIHDGKKSSMDKPIRKEVVKGERQSFSGLPMGTELQCTVISLYANDRNGQAKVHFFKTPAADATKPRFINVAQNKNDPLELDVSWTPPIFPASEYQVCLFVSGQEEHQDISSSEICEMSFGGLRPNVAYTCSVQGLYPEDGIGEVAHSEPVNTGNSNITCRTVEGHVMCTWKGDKKKQYSVQLKRYDGSTMDVTDVKHTKAVLGFDKHKIKIGEQIKISITKENNSVGHTQFVVGSDTRPLRLRAFRDSKDPHKIEVKWDEPACKPPRYKAAISEEGGRYSMKKDTKETKFTFSALCSGTVYKVTISAILGDDDGLSSSITIMTATEEEIRPQNAKADVNPEDPFKIIVSWDKPKFPPSSYIVREVTGAKSIIDKQKTDQTFTSFTTTQLGEKFKFEITPTYHGGKEGLHSSTKNLETGANEICEKTRPKETKATMSKSDAFSLMLQWAKPDKTPIEYEIVTIRDGEKTVSTSKKTEKTFQLDNLGSSFSFIITGIYRKNRKGLPAITDKLETARITDTMPTEVEVIQSQTGPQNVKVMWVAPAVNCDSYEIEVIEKGTRITTLTTVPSEREITSLKSSTSYVFAVRGLYKHRKGCIAQSQEYITPSEKETAPKSVKALANPRDPFELIVSWEPTTIPPQRYKLTLMDSKREVKNDSTVNHFFTFKNLIPSTKYRVGVIAIFADGTQSFDSISEDATTASRTVLKPRGVLTVPSERELTVSWTAPEASLELTMYTCKIFENGKFFESEDCRPTENKISFPGLRNGHRYKCEVFAKYKDDKAGFATVDNIEINTKRNPDYNITKLGAAQKVVTSTSIERGKVTCNVSWVIPDLGDEGMNFTRKSSITLWKKNIRSGIIYGKYEDWVPDKTAKLANETTTYSITDLPYGENYKVEIEFSYWDLDKRKTLVSSASGEFSTGAETPKNLQVDWRDEKLIMKWDKALGATEYKISVLDPENRRAYFGPITQAKTTMTTGMLRTCRYGQKRIFQVMAIWGDIYSNPCEVELIIGGDRVVKNVTLDVGDDPRRQLNVSWEKPDKSPDAYRVTLKLNEGVIKNMELKSHENSLTFSELQPDHSYYCEVLAVYEDGRGCGAVWSINTKTWKRTATIEEKSPTFGHPGLITHNIAEDSNDCSVDLSWTKIRSTENYEFLRYNIKMCEESRQIENKPLLQPQYRMDCLSLGARYTVEITSHLLDRDTKKVKSETSNLEFFTRIQAPVMEKCKWKAGIVTFTWNKVNGAKEYNLLIQDEFGSEELVNEPCRDKNEYDVQMKGHLRMGKSCLVKVTAVGRDKQTADTGWIPHTIGDSKVPRNVRVAMHTSNKSGRCVLIEFDQPLCEISPVKYRVEAVPQNGNNKAENFNEGEKIIFKYLRREVNYHFVVQAIYPDNTQSEGSFSDIITLKTDKTLGTSTMDFSQMKGGNVKISKSVFHAPENITSIHLHPTDELGKVRNGKTDIRNTADNVETYDVSWESPGFAEKRYDYKICRYHLSLKRDEKEFQTKIREHIEDQDIYSWKGISMNCGFQYQIQIMTEFEDIDRDCVYKSGYVAINIATKPCSPRLSFNEWSRTGDILTLRWEHAEGARVYRVEIYDRSGQLLASSTRLSEPEFIWKPDPLTPFGKDHTLKLFSLGDGERENNFTSDFATLGGKFVPKNVTAAPAGDGDDLKQAIVKWGKPENVSDCSEFHVYAYEKDNLEEYTKSEVTDKDANHCEISGLRAGVEYQFKVQAVHKWGTAKFASPSDPVRMEETPAQVKNITAYKIGNSSIKFTWDAMESGALKYHLKMESSQPYIKYRTQTSKTHHTWVNLHSGQTYFVQVKAENEQGCGRWSKRAEVKTEYGTPSGIKLVDGSLTTTFAKIMFTEAPDSPTKYAARIREISGHVVFDKRLKIETLLEQEGPNRKTVSCMLKHENAVGWTLSINGLRANTEYEISLEAFYGSASSGEIEKMKIITIPAKARHPKVDVEMIEKWYSSNTVNMIIRAQPGCNIHQIHIASGTNTTESTFVIIDKMKHRYVCRNEGLDYTFQVRSQNKSGLYGEWSEKTQVHLAPPAIRNVNAIRVGSNFKVSWDSPHKSATRVNIKVIRNHNTEKPEHEDNIGADLRNFTYKPKSPATQYSFIIHAIRPVPQSTPHPGEPKKTVEILSKPVPGGNLAVMPSGRSIHLRWAKISKGCERYHIKIKRKDLMEQKLLLPTDKTELTCSNLSCGGTYEVKLRNIYQSVEGDWSEVQSVMLAPGKISCASAKIKNMKMIVEWKKMDNVEYVAQLYRCDSEATEMEIATYKGKKATWKCENRLQPGRSYYCKVFAENATGKGEEVQTRLCKAPWNRNLKLSISKDIPDPSSMVKLTWEAPDGVDYFMIAFDHDPAVKVTGSEYTYSGGIPGTTHCIRLWCCSGENSDDECTKDTFTLHPTPPNKLSIWPSEDPRVIILVIADNMAMCAKRMVYVYTASNGQQIQEQEIKADEVPSIRNLEPGQKYFVGVKNIDRCGQASVLIHSEAVLTRPGQVKHLNAVKNDDGTRRLKWDTVASAKSYEVHWNAINTSNSDFPLRTTFNRDFLLEGLRQSTIYSIKVRAVNDSGEGPFSESVTFFTAPKVTARSHENHPGIIVVEAGTRCEDLSYQFVLYRSTSDVPSPDDEIARESSKTSNYVFSAITPGTEYIVGARAVDEQTGNKSDESFSLRVKTEFNPIRNLKVQHNPQSTTSSLIVSYEDDPNPLKMYTITAHNRRDETKNITKTTNKMEEVINGLLGGQEYRIGVKTTIDSLVTEEIF